MTLLLSVDSYCFYYQSTVTVGALQKNDIVHLEVFDPMIPVTRFSDVDEEVNLANDSD